MKNFLKSLIMITTFSMLFSCGGAKEENNDDISVKMLATVVGLGQKLEVEVVEGEYDASGTYIIITSEATEYFDADGNRILREDIGEGDTVEIIYGGQVMMSLPPQVVAKRITLK